MQAGAEALRAKLERTRQRLEKVRRAGAPPRTPDQPPDGHQQVGFPPNRADALLPFILIRTFRGDDGARPLDPSIHLSASPDIVVAERLPAGSPPEPEIRGRAEFLDPAFAGRIAQTLVPDFVYDVWIHVWNLGRAPANGVRVRAWSIATGGAPAQQFVGGRRIDLGDRASESSHVVVRIGSWMFPMANFAGILTTAECITDVSTSAYPHDYQDRHNASRYWSGGIPWT